MNKELTTFHHEMFGDIRSIEIDRSSAPLTRSACSWPDGYVR